MNEPSHWGHFPRIDSPTEVGIDESLSGLTGTARIYGAPAPVRRLLHRLRAAGILRCQDPHMATDGASDRELHRLAGPLGRLRVEDVRWDVIGAAHSGKRHRI